MPWTSRQAQRHTKKANTRISKKQWAEVANSVLNQTGDEAKAIRAANSAVAKRRGRKRRP